jgi:competence protein ComEA
MKKIWVPSLMAVSLAMSVGLMAKPATGVVVQPLPTKVAAVKRVAFDINQADIQAWQQLKGVGPKLAARIVKYRQVHGVFKRPEALLAVKGIGAKKMAALASRNRVVFKAVLH